MVLWSRGSQELHARESSLEEGRLRRPQGRRGKRRVSQVERLGGRTLGLKATQ